MYNTTLYRAVIPVQEEIDIYAKECR